MAGMSLPRPKKAPTPMTAPIQSNANYRVAASWYSAIQSASFDSIRTGGALSLAGALSSFEEEILSFLGTLQADCALKSFFLELASPSSVGEGAASSTRSSCGPALSVSPESPSSLGRLEDVESVTPAADPSPRASCKESEYHKSLAQRVPHESTIAVRGHSCGDTISSPLLGSSPSTSVAVRFFAPSATSSSLALFFATERVTTFAVVGDPSC